MHHSIFYIFLFLNFLWITGCQKQKAEEVTQKKSPRSGKLMYNLQKPDKKYFLPDPLEEISGHCLIDSVRMACVQDEEGKLFVYHLSQKRIVQRPRFAKNGDYEDVAVTQDGQIYVVKSNGSLYSFRLSKEKKIKSTEINTPLSIKNDVEGICYDPTRNRLLLTCKQKAGIKDKEKDGKAIYAFDLKSQKLLTEPAYLINLDELEDFLTKNALHHPDKKMTFKPSAIGIHPEDHRLYLLASEGNLLLVLNEDGTFYEVLPLNPRIFKQPEGICFAEDGTMYISSEGRESNGYLLRFNPLREP